MKIAITTLIALVGLSQPMQSIAQKPVKVVINVPGAQDEACKTRIENYLKREYGVVESNVNYRRHTVTVKFLPDRTNIENIKTAIANRGYDADDVKANPESYKRLPKTCQHHVEEPARVEEQD